MPEIVDTQQGIDRWFLGGGSEHTPESARRQTFIASRGAEGTIEPSHLRVVPLDVPGAGVRVLPGSALINSRYTGGEDQSYTATVTTAVTLTTTPTGSTPPTGRSDLIVLQVEDPHAANSPWTLGPGTDEADAQYIYARVISGVPANTTRLQQVAGYTNSTAITLARVDFPASTGTVTAGMITDLREEAQPRESTVVRAFGVSSGDGVQQLTNSTELGVVWPNASIGETNFAIDIPKWATQMLIECSISGVKVPGGGNAQGWYWVQVGGNGEAYVSTNPTRWDVDETSGQHRVSLITGDTVNVPSAMRGTRKRFYPKGRKTSGSNDKSLVADPGTSVLLRVTFRQVKE